MSRMHKLGKLNLTFAQMTTAVSKVMCNSMHSSG